MKDKIVKEDSLISIAMCTYNGEVYLKHQLDSILNQSYKNIELIIVDDISTDNTLNILREYAKTDNRIKIYENEQNLGFIKNFERAISLCSGEFIALSDQDDIWKPQKLEYFYTHINNNILIYSDAILIDENEKKLNKMLISPKKNMISGNNNRAFIFSNCVSGNTLMFKKELTQHILPIPKEINYHDVWIAFVATTYGTITYSDEAMVYYRQHSNQITKDTKEKHTNFLLKLKKKKLGYIEKSKEVLNNVNALLKLKILDDNTTINILKSLKTHHENYEYIYYNRQLHKELRKYKKDLFAILDDKKQNKMPFQMSLGLKYKLMNIF